MEYLIVLYLGIGLAFAVVDASDKATDPVAYILGVIHLFLWPLIIWYQMMKRFSGLH